MSWGGGQEAGRSGRTYPGGGFVIPPDSAGLCKYVNCDSERNGEPRGIWSRVPCCDLKFKGSHQGL